MATPVSGVNAWLTIGETPLLFEQGEENLAAKVSEYRTHYLRTTPQAPQMIEIFIDHSLLKSEHYGLWQWRPEHYAGRYELRVRAPGYPDHVTHVRVQPQKFTQRLYRSMQDDLSAIAIDLLFRLKSPASEQVEAIKRRQDASPLQDYRKVRQVIEQLKDILAHIRRTPHHTLTNRAVQIPWDEVSRFHRETIPTGSQVVRLTRTRDNGPQERTIPATWRVPQATISYDVYENRLLKQFIQKQLVTKITAIGERAEKEVQLRTQDLAYKRRHHFADADDTQAEIDALRHVIRNCQWMKQRCLHWSNEPFLHTVTSEVLTTRATQILLKHPSYSRLYRIYVQFQQQFKLSLNMERSLADLQMRKVSDLYELWSVFEVTRIAIAKLQANGYTMVSSTLFYEVEKDYFQFDIQRNKASIILAKGDIRVEMKYEPVYPNHALTHQAALVSTIGKELPQTPDMAIEVYRRGVPERILVFDAKYRREKVNGAFYPKEEDIDKMYRYQANIQYQRYDPQHRRFRAQPVVTTAYAIYPGNKVYTESDEHIGRLPLIPEQSPQLLHQVKEKVADILYAAYLID